jgi:chemotaxis protein CheD
VSSVLQQTPAARLVIGVGELAVAEQGTTIVTHGLGSCIAVCIWDPGTRIGGMIHFLLPDSRINPERAARQPAAFADTGVPLLFQTAYAHGLIKARTVVALVGGADISRESQAGLLNVGRRNTLAARNLLWRNGVLIRKEDVGGSRARTVSLSVGDGRILISAPGEAGRELWRAR